MDKKILIEYKKINSKGEKRFVYHLGVESGFFSEFNNMVLAMLYCLENKIKFSLYSKDANFKYDIGWNDYFIPFCEEYGNFMHSLFNKRPNGRFKNSTLKKIDKIVCYLFRSINSSVLTTTDLWDKFRGLSPEKRYFIPELDIDGDLRHASKKIIEMIWNYRPDIKEEIEFFKKKLILPNSYIGLHIRGGDKGTEANLICGSEYIKKAEEVSSLRNAFVLTDDYQIIEDLEKKYKNWKFYTLCNKNERGYFHNNFVKESSATKKQRYINLFTSVDILADADCFIGTFSSNPGMYIGMRKNPAYTYSIDIPNWQIW